MRRKINIGAALLHRPKLLLLDEPVANLDGTAEEQVLTALKRLAAQGTAIVYGIITAAVIPVAIFALGTVVYVKRKHM